MRNGPETVHFNQLRQKSPAPACSTTLEVTLVSISGTYSSGGSRRTKGTPSKWPQQSGSAASDSASSRPATSQSRDEMAGKPTAAATTLSSVAAESRALKRDKDTPVMTLSVADSAKAATSKQPEVKDASVASPIRRRLAATSRRKSAANGRRKSAAVPDEEYADDLFADGGRRDSVAGLEMLKIDDRRGATAGGRRSTNEQSGSKYKKSSSAKNKVLVID